ncbi:MAG: hypothetical protein MPN21_04700 [Thermoanaerobaculia bacterium]|nr:hypothetical protein [Thermoanaerobaculia bacterium]
MRTKWSLSVLVLLLTFAGVATAAEETAFDAQAAFDRLTELAGTWTGTAAGEGKAAEESEGQDMNVTHRFQVSANGTVVMETMNPGTEHEMINMYHLDGDDLMLTHYCAGGNQPRMRIVAAESSPDHLVFDFDGGTNLDPAVDGHIHAARIQLKSDEIHSAWISYYNGEQGGKMTFYLTRAE